MPGSISGIICTCFDPTYDELGCTKCIERALSAIEHPEDSLPSTPAATDLELATEKKAVVANNNSTKPAVIKGVFCTCLNSEYDEIGCDRCAERAFRAMGH